MQLQYKGILYHEDHSIDIVNMCTVSTHEVIARFFHGLQESQLLVHPYRALVSKLESLV